MRTGLAIDSRFRAHVPPGRHPEQPARIAAIEALLADRGLTSRTQPLPVRRAERRDLERAHDGRYLDLLERALSTGTSGWLDPDTYYSAGSWEAALCAAGAAVDAARAVAGGALDNAAVVVRPPGHHATRDRAMGFCLLNNAAVAAAALRDEGLRVAVVDFDVHHGNGTQDIFWEDPRVFYASTHQFPCYPGTGALSERGAGAGLGATLNVPLPAGTGDDGFLGAYDEIVLPAIDRFRPDLIVASAGFDAHADDPLAELRVSSTGFARLASRLSAAVSGKLVVVLEGGYDLAALSQSFAGVVGVLVGDEAADAVERSIDRTAPLDLGERRALDLAARSLAELPPPAPR